MSRPPLAHKIKRPNRYVPAAETNIRRRFEVYRRLQRMKKNKAEAEQKVTSIQPKKEAA
jgi:hypothetical protein